jgi:hypothetical protein
MMRYNLACYACQLGNLKGAKAWLGKAIDLAGKKDIRLMALDDPDLEPPWSQIGKIIIDEEQFCSPIERGEEIVIGLVVGRAGEKE